MLSFRHAFVVGCKPVGQAFAFSLCPIFLFPGNARQPAAVNILLNASRVEDILKGNITLRPDRNINRAIVKEQLQEIVWEVGFENYLVISSLIFTRDEIENSPLRSSPIVRAIAEEGIRL